MSDGRYVVHIWFDDRPEPETSNAMFLEEAVPLMAHAKTAGLRAKIAILTPANWHETLGTARARPQSLSA